MAKCAPVTAVIAGSFIAEGAARTGLSWGLDAVALAVWAACRLSDR
jgi:hypothetical protein